MLLDPREGDVENDRSSPKARSLLAIAGSLLVEISPIKLAGAFIGLIVAPALLLGALPLITAIGWSSLSGRFDADIGLWSLLVVGLLLGLGFALVGPFRRIVEASFWSMNALLVQPAYAFCREALRHLADRSGDPLPDRSQRASRSAMMALGAGIGAAALSALLALLLWPATRWEGVPADLLRPSRLLWPVLANAGFIVAGYAALAALAWGFADASMPQPQDLDRFDDARPGARRWRVAHLSDVHVVGERYGFRIESGRLGPRGNERFRRVLARLAEIDAAAQLDLVMVTGDMTDAGKASEWAEFMSAIEAFPALTARMLILPGNHDLNIVDAGNPARLHLPFGPMRPLRKVRLLAAMLAIQGDRARVPTGPGGPPGATLAEILAPYRALLTRFADSGGIGDAMAVEQLWRQCFPQIIPPAGEDGLGIILLDSNAGTHFSFTNALGMLTGSDARTIAATLGQSPRAGWLLGLHHHLVEYPRPAKVMSERIGTALINGSWFVRSIDRHGTRMVAMHGHRHKDWIGRCGRIRIVSAPSPVMDATRFEPTRFYIHTLEMQGESLALLTPEAVVMVPEATVN